MFGDIMTNVIYSFYTEIEDKMRSHSNFYGDKISKAEKTKSQFIKYKNRLINSKTDYARICDADFILFDDIPKDNFDSINFYKHKLMEDLLKEYDNVLYLDFDVIPNTNESFFKVHDMNKINVHAVNSTKKNTWSNAAQYFWKRHEDGRTSNIGTKEEPIMMTPDRIIEMHFDKYHMYCKALCKLSMLSIDNIFSDDYHIANTGIVGGSAESLSQIQMTKRMNNMIEVFNDAIKESPFSEEYTKYFFINNEVFFSYILDKYKLDWYNLPFEWHHYHFHMPNEHKIFYKNKLLKAKMIHMIDKDFGIFYDV